MRSKAHFKAHPLHPALVPFPFAFLIGALLFDAAGVAFNRPALSTSAGHLAIAGLIGGLLAAIPGVVDYLYAVPPRSSAQARARTHGILNVMALALFAAAWWTREPAATAGLATLGLELLGAGVLAYAGSLGGTLVTRNMIGVDHRYARAGKWQEATHAAPDGTAIDVGGTGDLEVDQMKLLHVNGQRIVLARTARGYTAFEDRCSHRGGSLAGGVMIGGVAQCLWHGSQFDGRSGEALCGPATRKVAAYTVREAGGRILLDL